MSISVSWQRKDGVLIGTLDGRIDGSNAREFQSILESGIEPGDGALILDFANVSLLSSAGLRVGLVIARRFNEQGRKFGLWPGKKFGVCALSEPVRATFSASGFEQLIAVYESQAEALKALAGGGGGGGVDRARFRLMAIFT